VNALQFDDQSVKPTHSGQASRDVASLPSRLMTQARQRWLWVLGAVFVVLLGPATARAVDPIALAAQVETGMLFVETDCPGASYSGSAFLIGPRLMVTARHVLQPQRGCSSTVTQQGSGAQAHVVRWSDWYSRSATDEPTTDLAVALLGTPLYGYDFKISSTPLAVGDRIESLGYPYAEALSVTQGTVVGTYLSGGVPETQMRLLSDHGGSGGPIINRSGEVVGLIQRGSRTARLIESIDLGRFVGGSPSNLCKGVATETSSTVCGGSTGPANVTGASSGLFTGRSLSVRYPRGWRVLSAEVNKGSYIDTTISDPSEPSWLLRIDESPGHNSPTPEYAAAPVLKMLRSAPGYRQLDLSDVLFLHRPALRWEFVVEQGGVLLHKVDIFFTDANGNDWGVLFQAPASEWANADPRFHASVASLRVD
jgi:hypothetical protein